MNMKLPIKKQQELVETLFGFCLVNVSDDKHPRYVLYDDNGDVFHSKDNNLQFDLTTLMGMFEYMKSISFESGYLKAQFDIRKSLGLINS